MADKFTLDNPLVRAHCERSEQEGGATGDWLFWTREHAKEKYGLIFSSDAELMYWYETHDAPPDSLQEFRALCQSFLERGENPTPTKLAEFGYGYAADRTLKSGRYTKVRRQELILAGWTFGENGRWQPPKRPFRLGDRVIATDIDGEEHHGTVTQVNDPDQGDFEYFVKHDVTPDSFWPSESLRKEAT